MERYYNQGWKPNWEDNNEYKYYPYFVPSGGFRFYYSYCDCSAFDGYSGSFKSKEISDFVGKTYIDIYKDLT